MASNVAFLKGYPQWQTVYEHAAEAEINIYVKPRTSLIYSRAALERAVRWMYSEDTFLELPAKSKITLSDLVHTKTFINAIPQALFDPVKKIIKYGNGAVHDDFPVTPENALMIFEYLFIFTDWMQRNYVNASTNRHPFDKRLIPSDVPLLSETTDDLKLLQQEVDAKNTVIHRMEKENSHLKQTIDQMSLTQRKRVELSKEIEARVLEIQRESSLHVHRVAVIEQDIATIKKRYDDETTMNKSNENKIKLLERELAQLKLQMAEEEGYTKMPTQPPSSRKWVKGVSVIAIAALAIYITISITSNDDHRPPGVIASDNRTQTNEKDLSGQASKPQQTSANSAVNENQQAAAMQPQLTQSAEEPPAASQNQAPAALATSQDQATKTEAAPTASTFESTEPTDAKPTSSKIVDTAPAKQQGAPAVEAGGIVKPQLQSDTNTGSAKASSIVPNVETPKPLPVENLEERLADAIHKNATNLAIELLQRGADPNSRQYLNTNGYQDFSALLLAVNSGNVSLVRALVEAGADVNYKTYINATPLNWCTTIKSNKEATEIAQILLKKGADPNAAFGNGQKRTPIIDAAAKNNFDMVKLLVEYKADINYFDADGKTALYVSLIDYEKENIEMAKFLLDRGADPYISAKNGSIAGIIASQSMYKELQPYLKKKD